MSGWNGTPFSGVGGRLGHDGEDEEKPKDTEIQTVDSDDEPNDVGDCPIFVILDSVLAKNGKLEEVCTVASSWLLRVPEHGYTSGIRKGIETLIDTTKTHIAHIEKFVNDSLTAGLPINDTDTKEYINIFNEIMQTFSDLRQAISAFAVHNEDEDDADEHPGASSSAGARKRARFT